MIFGEDSSYNTAESDRKGLHSQNFVPSVDVSMKALHIVGVVVVFFFGVVVI